jgi:hypothetical protein
MSDSDSAIVDTPFKEAIAVKIIGTEENTTILTGNVPWDWTKEGKASPSLPEFQLIKNCSAAFGGFVSSLIFNATTYFLTYHPSNPKLDPINSYVQYLYSLPPRSRPPSPQTKQARLSLLCRLSRSPERRRRWGFHDMCVSYYHAGESSY